MPNAEYEVDEFLKKDLKWPQWLENSLGRVPVPRAGQPVEQQIAEMREWGDKLRGEIISVLGAGADGTPGLIERGNDDRHKIVHEYSMERFSSPKANQARGGGFASWTSGVPDGWTAWGTATLSQQTVRPGGMSTNSSCRVVVGAATTGGIQQNFRFQAGRLQRLSLWVKLTTAAATIELTSDGTNPVAMARTFAVADYGAGWIPIPGPLIDEFAAEVPSDATYVTCKLGGAADSQCEFCEVQWGYGIRRDADLWQPSDGDNADLPTSTNKTYTKVKTQDESVTNSTVLQNDDELLIAVAANENWAFEFALQCVATLATTGIKLAVTFPAGSTVFYCTFRFNHTAQEFYASTATGGAALDMVAASFATTAEGMVIVKGTCRNGATAGNIQLQWAESTGGVGTTVTVKAGSAVKGQKE